ncbi:MAG: cytochrome-c oxidase, cbb3-type subunit II, partial [Betaproteobacteria bacterium]|nr:cytochrome-c oxidase, cbb3-type subunit II [Betaproteobacteria bacterium]
MGFRHDIIEKRPALLIVMTLIVVAIGGLVEIAPLFFQTSTTQPVSG